MVVEPNIRSGSTTLADLEAIPLVSLSRLWALIAEAPSLRATMMDLDDGQQRKVRMIVAAIHRDLVLARATG